jgi:hypothetical protein
MLAIAATAALFLMHPPAAAAPSASPCLAPISPGEADPQVRDVRIVADPANPAEPDVEACIVSKNDAAQMSMNFGIFDKAGLLLGSGTQYSGHWVGTDQAPGNPNSILTVRVPVPTSAAVPDAGALLDEVLATLQAAPCLPAGTDPCGAAGAAQPPLTFLRAALSDTVGPVPKFPRDDRRAFSGHGSRRQDAHCAAPTASSLRTTVDTAHDTVETEVTVDVPCLNSAAPLGVSFSLFKADGTLLSVTANDATSGASGTRQTYSATTDLAAADMAQPLLGKVLVNIGWEACDPSVTASCVNGSWYAKAYLLDAPQLSRKGDRATHR